MNLLGSIGASLIIFALTRGQFFWGISTIDLDYSFGAGALLLAGIILLSLNRFKFSSSNAVISGIIIWFLSDVTITRYSLINGGDCVSVIIILFASLYVFKDWHKKLIYILIGFSLLLFFELSRVLGSELLISDDHSANIYRLALLSKHFPNIPFYNPMWNAGEEARDFYATGILNLYLIFSPFLAIFKSDQIYNYLVCTILFFLLPFSVYFGAILWNKNENEDLDCETYPEYAAISAILALTSSLVWYRWALKYGSMGFITTCTLIPLASGLIFRTITKNQSATFRLILSTILISTLILFWTLGGVALILIILTTLCFRPEALKTKKLYLAAAFFILINLTWLIPFFTASKVFDFVGISPSIDQTLRTSASVEFKDEITQNKKVKAKVHTLDLKGIVKGAREFFVNVNPLIIFLAPFGICRRNRPLALTIAALFGIGLVISPLKPQLELERMLVIGTILATILAGRVWVNFDTSAFKRNLFGALLFTGFLFTSQIVGDRSIEKYYISDDDYHKMVEILKANIGTGRALFSGFVLHELSGGHLAPLQSMTELPLMASAPTHSVWWYTDIVPEEFRNRGFEGNEEFFEYFNVSLVLAHENNWRTYFRANPKIYEEVGNAGRFIVFKRTRKTESYVLEGSINNLTQNEAELSFEPVTSSVILKYRYLPILKSSNCVISPYSLTKNEATPTSLIKLDQCRIGEKTQINTKTISERILKR